MPDETDEAPQKPPKWTGDPELGPRTCSRCGLPEPGPHSDDCPGIPPPSPPPP
jgi:hypothetical protein